MANWNIATFTKWSGSNPINMAVAETYPGSWTDLGQQNDTTIRNRSVQFCTMALGKVSDATLALIQADTRYLILARYEADVISPSFDNQRTTITAPQQTIFVSHFLTEYGINVAKLPVIAGCVGRSRLAVIRDIAQDLRNLT